MEDLKEVSKELEDPIKIDVSKLEYRNYETEEHLEIIMEMIK